MTLPTVSEEYAKLMEHLRKAQESSAMIAHLRNEANSPTDREMAQAWLAVSKLFKQMQDRVTRLVQGRLH